MLMLAAARMCKSASKCTSVPIQAIVGLQVYPLESAESAHARMQSGRNFGKIILTTTLL